MGYKSFLYALSSSASTSNPASQLGFFVIIRSTPYNGSLLGPDLIFWLLLASGGCLGALCTQMCSYRSCKKKMGRFLSKTTHHFGNHPIFQLPAVHLVDPLELSGNLCWEPPQPVCQSHDNHIFRTLKHACMPQRSSLLCYLVSRDHRVLYPGVSSSGPRDTRHSRPVYPDKLAATLK